VGFFFGSMSLALRILYASDAFHRLQTRFEHWMLELCFSSKMA
jgi:hypothetical protein